MGKSHSAAARCILFIVVAFTLSATARPARADWSYHSDTGGYTLTLPDDWMQIPPDSLQHSPTADPAEVPVGFQKKGKALFTGPMCFIMPQKYTDGIPPSDAELPKYVESLRSVDYGKTMKDALSGSVDKAPYQAWSDASYWDKDSDSLLLTLHIVVNGSDPRTGVIAHHLGRYSGMATFCYSAEDGWEALQPTFNQISDSFKFDSGWGFDGRNHHPLIATKDLCIIGGAILTVLIFHFKPKKRVHVPPMIVSAPPPASFEHIVREIKPVPMKDTLADAPPEPLQTYRTESLFEPIPEPHPEPRPEFRTDPRPDFKPQPKGATGVQTFLSGL